MQSKESAIKLAVIISLSALLALSALFLLYGWICGHFDSATAFRAYVESFGFFAPFVLTLIQILQVILPVCRAFWDAL